MSNSAVKSRAFEGWELLLDLVLLLERSRLPAIAAEVGLPEAQCHTLRLLDPDHETPMRRLVECLSCDASNVTGIVDRLEARGLIERRVATADRRVKVIALTDAGRATRRRLLERLGEPPEPIARLSAADRKTLCAILRRALRR